MMISHILTEMSPKCYYIYIQVPKMMLMNKRIFTPAEVLNGDDA